MSDEEKINPGHKQLRNTLRIVGPLILAVGGLFMLIGLGNFFSSFGSFEPPRLFWCCFVGMPLIAVGIAMSQFGFLGAITRYQAGEIAPVGKDTFNYMAEGTKQGVQTVATAIGAGFANGSSSGKASCPACGHSNSLGANFCDDCGAAMSKTCSSCGKINDGDAKFCDGCGDRIEMKA